MTAMKQPNAVASLATVLVVIAAVSEELPLEIGSIPKEEMIEIFAAERTDHALHERVRPRRERS